MAKAENPINSMLIFDLIIYPLEFYLTFVAAGTSIFFYVSGYDVGLTMEYMVKLTLAPISIIFNGFEWLFYKYLYCPIVGLWRRKNKLPVECNSDTFCSTAPVTYPFGSIYWWFCGASKQREGNCKDITGCQFSNTNPLINDFF